MSRDQSGKTIDRALGVAINGEMYYPVTLADLESPGMGMSPSELNPCAGKRNGASCGPGCVCLNGQCYYMLFKLHEMGLTLSK
jgi:hypothetical protein